MEAKLVFQGKNDPPQLNHFTSPFVDLTSIQTMTFCLIEGGMQSGEPSVIMMVEDKTVGTGGTVAIQTSLDKLIMAARAFMSGAESRWGWKQPEGSATLMPMPKENRKALLESIKKELEEWDESS